MKPGWALRVGVVVHRALEGGEWEFKGEAQVVEPQGGPGATAVSGRFVLRPAR